MTLTRLVPALTVLMLAVPAQAQTWSTRPDDPSDQAERQRLERERWRTAQDLRDLQSLADQRRTESVLRAIEAQRSPAYVPPPPGQAYLGPVDPALVAPDPASSRRAADNLDQGLGGLRGWLDRTRPE